VGISQYEFGPNLPNSTADAVAIERTFRKLGYQTVLALDVNRRDMLLHLARLRLQARDAFQVVIYFSGHAVLGDSESLLLLADTAMDATNVRHDAIPLRVLTRALSDRPRQKILLLDSCRDNPVYHQKPLAPPSRWHAPAGLYLGYASQPGRAAFDGSTGHSPFATA